MEIIVDDVTNMPLVSANKLSLYSGYKVTLLPGEEKEVHTGVRIQQSYFICDKNLTAFQVTSNRQQATGKSFNFFIYFLICHNLFGIAIDLTDEYQGVLVERLKMEGVKLDLADGFISQKPGCVKAI